MGGGIYAYSTGSYVGYNNIVTDNVSTTYPDHYGNCSLTYTCSEQGMAGTGNINVDPMFTNPAMRDFTLLAMSPCVDAGDPASPHDPDSTIADMGALYFEQSGSAVQVPNSPSNFTVNHNNEQLIASLDWVNPNLNIIQQPLESLTGVKIYRNETLIDDVTDVVMGQPYSYDDNTVPAPGGYAYEIVPYNIYGDGYSAIEANWIGLDTPGESQNTVATPDPGQELECTLTWSAPVEGEHGGYYNPTSFTGQKIYRDGELLVDLPGVNTSYVDDSMTHNGFYSYSIVYYNVAGDGMETFFNPNPVFIGPPLFEVIQYDWVEISTVGTNTGLTGDDQTLGPFPIGFDFPYYDNNYYNQVWVCSNGWISFSSGQGTAYNNATIPTAGSPNNIICPYWDDLTPSTNSRIYYYDDIANNRFIVEFNDVPHYSTGGMYTFEAIFYTNGDVDFLYQELTPGDPNSATVGFENASGSEGVLVTYNGSGPLNPLAGMAIRIYSVAPETPTLELTLTPAVTPIQIPGNGGTFDYEFLLDNTGTTTAFIDVWMVATLPNGSDYQVALKPDVTIPAGVSVLRELTQNVPSNAPAGNYVYHGYAGNHPNIVYAEDSFPFTKLAGDGLVNPDNSWNLYGWDGLGFAVDIPDVFAMHGAYPNPFNPETTIDFDVPETGMVQLIIYDIQGREVARLADGVYPAGYHQASFNASVLSSGVYFARFIAADYNRTQKLLLVK